MKYSGDLFQTILFLTISAIGGFLLSLTGLPVGWMIGTLLTATLLSILRPKFLLLTTKQSNSPKFWLFIGQCMLGIELGQKLNSSVIYIFKDNWLTISIMLFLSILFSLFLGIILWKYSSLDMLTSFFSTAPGGLSAIPGIAEEVGANTGVVSIIQTMRVFLVILLMPVIISFLVGNIGGTHNNYVMDSMPKFEIEQMAVTILFVFLAVIGYNLGKFLKFPAPWLIGSMISIAIVKIFSIVVLGLDLVAYWPHTLIIVSQIFIGASIGLRLKRNMFKDLKRTLFVSFLSTLALILFVFMCAYFLSTLTNITFLTASLAFAPGGIAEMTTTALVLHADPTFVVTVQVIRIVTVCIMLPPFFRLLKYLNDKKKVENHIST